MANLKRTGSFPRRRLSFPGYSFFSAQMLFLLCSRICRLRMERFIEVHSLCYSSSSCFSKTPYLYLPDEKPTRVISLPSDLQQPLFVLFPGYFSALHLENLLDPSFSFYPMQVRTPPLRLRRNGHVGAHRSPPTPPFIDDGGLVSY